MVKTIDPNTIKRQINEANKFAELSGKSIEDLFALSKSEREQLFSSYGKKESTSRLINAGIERSYEGSGKIVPLSEISKKLELSNKELLENYKYHAEAAKRIKTVLEERKEEITEVEEIEEVESESEEIEENLTFSRAFKDFRLRDIDYLIPNIRVGTNNFKIEVKDFGLRIKADISRDFDKQAKFIENFNLYELNGSIEDFIRENNFVSIPNIRISCEYKLSDGTSYYFSSKRDSPNLALQDFNTKLRMLLEQDNSFSYEISYKFD
ncbi:MAG: hypothetical protein ACFFKA_05835, partial [Candidatus Thorarchaeota archaeon]